MILSCIRYLRQKFPTVRVSVEVEKPGRPGLQELATEADVVFYSKSWAQVLIALIVVFDISRFDDWSLIYFRETGISQPRSASRSSPH